MKEIQANAMELAQAKEQKGRPSSSRGQAANRHPQSLAATPTGSTGNEGNSRNLTFPKTKAKKTKKRQRRKEQREEEENQGGGTSNIGTNGEELTSSSTS